MVNISGTEGRTGAKDANTEPGLGAESGIESNVEGQGREVCVPSCCSTCSGSQVAAVSHNIITAAPGGYEEADEESISSSSDVGGCHPSRS